VNAGWFPDPSGQPGQRYYDGQRWTLDGTYRLDNYNSQETIKRPTFPDARRPLEGGWMVTCLNGHMNPDNQHFCGECRGKLVPQAPPPTRRTAHVDT
jgi:hypothetical protein